MFPLTNFPLEFYGQISVRKWKQLQNWFISVVNLRNSEPSVLYLQLKSPGDAQKPNNTGRSTFIIRSRILQCLCLHSSEIQFILQHTKMTKSDRNSLVQWTNLTTRLLAVCFMILSVNLGIFSNERYLTCFFFLCGWKLAYLTLFFHIMQTHQLNIFFPLSSWPFSLTDSIQPVALRVTRPLIALVMSFELAF